MKKLIKNTTNSAISLLGLEFLPNEYFELYRVYWHKAAENAQLIDLVTSGSIIIATETSDLSATDGINYLVNNILPSSSLKFSINKVDIEVEIPTVSQMIVHNELVDDGSGDLIINGELVLIDDRG